VEEPPETIEERREAIEEQTVEERTEAIEE
jgi:hypothetical protein